MTALTLLFLPLVNSINVASLHSAHLQRGSGRLTQVQCPTYSCADSPLTGNLCVEYVDTSDEYLLQECKSTQVCDAEINQQANVTCTPAPPPSHPKFPGSPCQSPSDCPSLNTCVKSVCHGGTQGSPCTVESTCDIGFVCYRPGGQAYCNKQLDFGDHCSGYIDDTLCRNDAVCGLYTCVPWFSLDNGQYTISAYAAYACKSGFYRMLDWTSEIVLCEEAPRSPPEQMPIACTPGSTCYSADGRYGLPCECGFNGQGAAYCPLFPGDDQYRQYLGLLQQYSTGLAACAFIAIGETQCGATTQLWEALNKASVSVAFWGMNEGNDECVKAIYTEAYWNETNPNLHPDRINQ